MEMPDFAALKYAEVQKLAKKAGIKANVKHEKLVAALSKYYNEVSRPGDKDTQVEKKQGSSAPVTPKAASRSVIKDNTPKERTPLKVKKPSTPASSSKPPIGKLSSVHRTGSPLIKKPSTPASTSKVEVGKLTPVHRIGSPQVRASPKNLHTPTGKTANVSGKKQSEGTSVAANTPVRSGPPSTKVSAEKQTPGRRKSSLNKPAANKNTPVNEMLPGSGKRKAEVSNTPTSSPPAKKRRSTFEVIPTPEGMVKGTPNIDKGSKREAKSSPGVQDMLGTMKPEMSNEEMKKSLMSAIDKKVQAKCLTESASKPSSSIPRFAAFLAKKKEQKSTTPGGGKKPVTPGNKDWAKIHQKNFDKFDSIDVYLDKKKQRAEEITASVKKAKNILAEVQASVNKLKSHKTPTSENLVKKPRSSNPNKTTPFKPTALNLSQANFNFGAMKSPKTLPRKSPKSMVGSIAKKVTAFPRTSTLQRKSTGTNVTSKPLATPFKFTAALNTTVHTTQSVKKNAFDLQASLAKPLTWKPHKGKLKPFGEKSPYKKPAIGQSIDKSRNMRRTAAAQRRADKKHDRQMARRGINV